MRRVEVAVHDGHVADRGVGGGGEESHLGGGERVARANDLVLEGGEGGVVDALKEVIGEHAGGVEGQKVRHPDERERGERPAEAGDDVDGAADESRAEPDSCEAAERADQRDKGTVDAGDPALRGLKV